MRFGQLKWVGLLMALIFSASAVQAESNRLQVVVSFSILADVVGEVGGDRIELYTLVGADSDAHVYQARPADVKILRGADVLVMNGLGFEGWLNRLQEAAGFDGLTLIAGQDIPTLDFHGHDHHESEAEHGEEHDEEQADPHIWHDIRRMMTVVDTVAAGLSSADSVNASFYQQNAADYKAQLAKLEGELKALVAQIPAAQRKVITTHDAFNYLSDAFAIEFLSAQGISTESEPSARDVAMLIRQIREAKIRAVFAENISDDRLIQQISRETGAVIGGTLYSGALSDAQGPAASYIALMRHNVTTLVNALRAE